MTDRAQCVETIERGDLSANTPYVADFAINSVSDGLQKFNRALILASQFKFYRATKVEYKWTPQFNTFQESRPSGSAPALTVPYLLMAMNRNGEQPGNAFTAAYLEGMGATPLKFTREIEKTFKPNTLNGVAARHNLVGANPPDYAEIKWSFTPKYDEWLSTEILSASPTGSSPPGIYDVATLDCPRYYGLMFYIRQANADNADYAVSGLTIKVHWEFKQPRVMSDDNQKSASAIAALFQ